jgi:hypothetical protein
VIEGLNRALGFLRLLCLFAADDMSQVGTRNPWLDLVPFCFCCLVAASRTDSRESAVHHAPQPHRRRGTCRPWAGRVRFRRMSTKEILREVTEKLPPDATLADAIYELEFRQGVEQGLAELDRGEGIPIEQVKAEMAQWLGR